MFVRVAALLAGAATLAAPGSAQVSQGPAPATQPAAAMPATPLDAAVFAQLPAVEGPQLSPDGKHYAAEVSSDGKQYFAIGSAEGAKPVFVGIGDNQLNWWHWVNDEWLVLGVGQVVPVQGDSWYITRVVSVRVDGTKLVPLVKQDAAQNADDVIWYAKDGTPRILMSYQSSIYSNDAGFWPKVDEVDVSTGRHHTVITPHQGVMSWYADGNGFVRMGIGHSDDGRSTRVLYRAPGTSNFRTIDRAATRDDDVIVPTLFLSDPTKSLMLDDDEQGFTALYELDLTTLQRGKLLHASKGYDLGGIVPDESGFGYVGVRLDENGGSVRWTNPEYQAIETAAAAKVKNAQVQLVSVSRDRSRAILWVGAPNAPGAYLLYEPKTDAIDTLGYVNATIRLRRLNPVRTIHYKARDGVDIAAVLTLPRGKTGKFPLIVMPHGGPFARDDESWDWWAQFLATKGYAVVQPNYRGSSGYGTKFARLGEGQWGLAMQDDLNDVIPVLAAQGIADPGRVCMVGGSYGGYAAMRAAQRDGKLYRCAVSFAGVSDLQSMKRYDSRFLNSGAGTDWLRKQAPDLSAVSPVNYPQQFSIPLLLVHGRKDQRVPVKQSRMLVDRLRDAGKPVEYVEEPEGDHHFTREEDRLTFLKALEAFLDKHNPA